MCACNATRLREGRGSKLQRRATVELRPSAPTKTRERKPAPELVSILQSEVLVTAATVVSSRTSAPSSRARVSSNASKKLRFIDNSPCAPEESGAVTLRPPIATNSTYSSCACGSARTLCASSSRSRIGQHDGFRQSPQTFSRGNFSRSRITVCRPARAHNAAHTEPAGPPPIMATSKNFNDIYHSENRPLIKRF